MPPITARASLALHVVLALTCLASVFVALRVWARKKRRTGLGTDDFLCFVSLGLMLGMLAELTLWCFYGGFGYHVKELSKDPVALERGLKIFLANEFTYYVLSACIRISFVCFYLRIFSTPRFRLFGISLARLIAVWGVATFIACSFTCRPLKAFWDHDVAGKCINPRLFFLVNAGFNVFVDLVILIMPIPMVWGLNTAWQDRLGLNAVFALGGFVCFTALYRIIVLFEIDKQDFQYSMYNGVLWSHIEPAVGIICSCLPIIRGLLPAYQYRRRGVKYGWALWRRSTPLSGDGAAPGSRGHAQSEYIQMTDQSRTSRGGPDTEVASKASSIPIVGAGTKDEDEELARETRKSGEEEVVAGVHEDAEATTHAGDEEAATEMAEDTTVVGPNERGLGGILITTDITIEISEPYESLDAMGRVAGYSATAG